MYLNKKIQDVMLKHCKNINCKKQYM
jgi:hypothetical protein